MVCVKLVPRHTYYEHSVLILKSGVIEAEGDGGALSQHSSYVIVGWGGGQNQEKMV
jgi:hypothetical protein